MEKWIQDILDVKESTLYATDGTSKQKIKAYNKKLRETISPENYVRYIIFQQDIYLDVFNVMIAAQNVYPNLEYTQIHEWIKKYKEPHQIVC